VRATIDSGNADEDVVGSGLGVLDEHIEVAVSIENARVQQLVLQGMPIALTVCLDELTIRKGCLRVLVEVLHVGMRGRRIEVEVVLLDVLPVIALATGEAEEPLFENRVPTIPQGERKA